MASVLRSVHYCLVSAPSSSSYVLACNKIMKSSSSKKSNGRTRNLLCSSHQQHCDSLSLSRRSGYGYDYGYGCGWSRRKMAVTPIRAGLTTSNLIFAFVFPLSLILVTVLASIRMADKLDQDYLEEDLVTAKTLGLVVSSVGSTLRIFLLVYMLYTPLPYLRLANNQAMMEGTDDDDISSPPLPEDKSGLPTKRNRPKRVAK